MKSKVFITIITILLIIPISVNAQTLKLTDKHINYSEYNNEYYTMFNKYDNNGKVNGFIVIEEYTKEIDSYYTSQMIKVFNNNNQLEKTYYEDDIIFSSQEPTQENPIEFYDFYEYDEKLNIQSKGNHDVSIIMYDDNDITKKQIKWTAQFGGNDNEELFSGIKDYENNEHTGYIFIGLTNSTNLKELTFGYFAIKYDLNGNVVWKKNIFENIASSILSYNNKGIVDGIITVDSGIFTKIKPDYTSEFEKFKSRGRYNSPTYTRDKNGKITGYTVVGDTCGSIEKRESADIQKRIFEPKMKNVKNIIKSSKIKLLDAQNCHPTITKFDLDGNLLEEKVLENINEAIYYQIKEIKNSQGKYDGYLMIGETPKKNSSYNYNGIITELDSDLNEENTEIYDAGDEENILYAIDDAYDMNGNHNGYNIVGTQICYTMAMNSTNKKGTMKLLTNDSGACKGSRSGFILRYEYPKFPIIKEEQQNGTIEIDEEAPAGSLVKLKIIPREGYYIEKVIVTDEKGNEIEVKDYSFIMPEGKVNVRAVFKRLINPETVSTIIIIAIITLIIGTGTLTTIKNKKTKKSDLI